MPGRYPKGTKCLVCGSEKVWARHLCRAHYIKWWSNQDRMKAPPRLLENNQGRKCHYCNDDAVAKGFCKRHYDTMLRIEASGRYSNIPRAQLVP